ncbi:MAG: hypothetical protein LH480_09185 [Rubrivivax sp.]|nr:hypothetical protein [Rubrivivax sp.]
MLSCEEDVYGAGVNLAARLCGLAGPGETVVSDDFRADLVDGLDGDVEDLGQCELKNLEGTVRAFRLGMHTKPPLLPGFDTLWNERPSFAVLPLDTDPHDPRSGLVADVIGDQLIHELSLCGVWRVISRLSMVAFKGRNPCLDELSRLLKPTWVISGRCRNHQDTVHVHLEVTDVRSGSVLWSERLDSHQDELLQQDGSLGGRLVTSMLRAVFNFELQCSRTQSLPTLTSHTLLLATIALMHRVSQQDFMRARGLLEQLTERHRRSPEPHAWFAKWHVMRVVQGWSEGLEHDVAAARVCANRALEHQPHHALSLAVDGLVAGLLRKDLALSRQRYEAAIAANPSEALAWLFMSALHAYCDEGQAAATAAETALRLSPLDPLRYFYDSFAAHALLAADRPLQALAMAERSMRAHNSHMPTHRTLIVAQMWAGRPDDARRSAARLLSLWPTESVSGFLRRHPGSSSQLARRSAEALRDAGLPLN